MQKVLISVLALVLCGALLFTDTGKFPADASAGNSQDAARGEETAAIPIRPEQPLRAYVLHVMDQAGMPVPDMYVNFCTDAACVMQKSDDTGTIAFDGEPGIYHIQLLKAPKGYSFDPGFELYTDSVYSEWNLYIRKNEETT